jgi:hypothetical protein
VCCPSVASVLRCSRGSNAIADRAGMITARRTGRGNNVLRASRAFLRRAVDLLRLFWLERFNVFACPSGSLFVGRWRRIHSNAFVQRFLRAEKLLGSARAVRVGAAGRRSVPPTKRFLQLRCRTQLANVRRPCRRRAHLCVPAGIIQSALPNLVSASNTTSNRHVLQ